jgi:hypothetical protein
VIERCTGPLDRLLDTYQMGLSGCFNDRQTNYGEHPKRALEPQQINLAQNVPQPKGLWRQKVTAMEGVHEGHAEDRASWCASSTTICGSRRYFVVSLLTIGPRRLAEGQGMGVQKGHYCSWAGFDVSLFA